MSSWVFFDSDHELFERELNSFVPDRIFDAHAHWYASDQFADDQAPSLVQNGPPIVGAAVFERVMSEMIPGRSVDGLFFPFPHPFLRKERANDYLEIELKQTPRSRGHLLVTPDDRPSMIHDAINRAGIVGLKCYHVYSPFEPTFESPITDFLPEPQWQVANELGLSITLHIVRRRGLADPENQATIHRMCSKYPDVRLILAHAARGFNPHHTMQGIDALRGLSNVWFDTSAVTDSGAFESILRTFGPRRLLYGSDFPVSQIRGRCVAFGDSFLWLTAENTRFEAPYGMVEPALVGHESLRSLKIAAQSVGLTDTDVEAVFYGNAMELWESR